MNKWFKLALNAFIGIIALSLILGIFFSGGIFFGDLLGALLVFAVKILYILLVVGLIVGTIVVLKDSLF